MTMTSSVFANAVHNVPEDKEEQFWDIVGMFVHGGTSIVFSNDIVTHAIGQEIVDMAMSDDPSAAAQSILDMFGRWYAEIGPDGHFVKIRGYNIEVAYVTGRVDYELKKIVREYAK